MKRFFAVLIALVAVCSVAGAQSWPRYERYQQADAEQAGKVKVAFMGDSITELWYGQDSEFFDMNGFAARGISSQTTYQMLARFRPDVVELKPKAVVILAGTNDIAMNSGTIDREYIVKNLISMCDIARNNGIKVYLCSILPCKGYSWRPELGNPTENIMWVNSQLEEYAKHTRKVTYVDYFNAVKDDSNALREDFTKDNCHPLLPCYKVMEKIITGYVGGSVNE